MVDGIMVDGLRVGFHISVPACEWVISITGLEPVWTIAIPDANQSRLIGVVTPKKDV